MMNILLLSPAYPTDMPEFTHGLAEAGARVCGVGDIYPAATSGAIIRLRFPVSKLCQVFG